MNLCCIGYGSIAKAHARAFRQWGGTRFHTVVGRRPEATEEFAREFEFENVTLDLGEQETLKKDFSPYDTLCYFIRSAQGKNRHRTK